VGSGVQNVLIPSQNGAELTVLGAVTAPSATVVSLRCGGFQQQAVGASITALSVTNVVVQ